MDTRNATAALMVLVSCGAAVAQVADEGRAFASELRADAMARTSLLDQGGAAAFAPKVSGFVLARYNINARTDSNLDANNNKTTMGGQLAYTKLQITGNIYSDAWGYGIQFKFGEGDGLAVLDDAYGVFKPEDQWQIKWGQFKPTLMREENISDTKQLSANRSVMNSVFTQSRTQGVQFMFTGDSIRFTGCFNDGIRTANVDFTGATEADYGFTGRLDYKWDGEWKQFDEFTSFPDSKYFGAAGLSAHYQNGGKTVATNDVEIFEGVGDVMVKGNGWNVYGAVVLKENNGATAQTFLDWGFILQGGYFIRPQWELFARFDSVIPDTDRATNDSFNTLTFGANKYISPNSHAIKLTLDLEWFLSKQSQSIAGQSTLTGLLASSKSNEFAIQAQLQLMF